MWRNQDSQQLQALTFYLASFYFIILLVGLFYRFVVGCSKKNQAIESCLQRRHGFRNEKESKHREI